MSAFSPWTISDWSAHSRENPTATADHFYNFIKNLPKNQVRAAIAFTPPRQDLIRALEKSASSPEKTLAGVPFLLKDLYDVAGWKTTASSLFLEEERPGPHKSSALASAFEHAGGVFAGKTHLVEFAYGLEGGNCHFGDGVHPKFPNRVSGGSSSGSVWAVASGLVPLASGSDTGGSVRVPAAYNGLYGIRVTPGHPWSKEGCFPLSPSFDAAGWFTRTAEDMVLTINALFQSGNPDQRSFKGIEMLPNYLFLDDGLSTPHQELVASLPVSKNPELTEEFKSLPDLVKAYLAISSTEAMQVHKDWHAKRKDQYDPQTWQRIENSKQWTPQDLDESVNVLNQTKRFFESLFAQYDFCILPASPVPAPEAGRSTAFREAHLTLTTPASLAGLPVLTLPYFMESGLSGGMQVIVPDLGPKSMAIWKQLLNDR